MFKPAVDEMRKVRPKAELIPIATPRYFGYLDEANNPGLLEAEAAADAG